VIYTNPVIPASLAVGPLPLCYAPLDQPDSFPNDPQSVKALFDSLHVAGSWKRGYFGALDTLLASAISSPSIAAGIANTMAHTGFFTMKGKTDFDSVLKPSLELIYGYNTFALIKDNLSKVEAKDAIHLQSHDFYPWRLLPSLFGASMVQYVKWDTEMIVPTRVPFGKVKLVSNDGWIATFIMLPHLRHHAERPTLGTLAAMFQVSLGSHELILEKSIQPAMIEPEDYTLSAYPFHGILGSIGSRRKDALPPKDASKNEEQLGIKGQEAEVTDVTTKVGWKADKEILDTTKLSGSTETGSSLPVKPAQKEAGDAAGEV
jgi:hypothetical protein